VGGTPLKVGGICTPHFLWWRRPCMDKQLYNANDPSIRRYERRRKMQKLGWFGGLGVTQGHRNHCHLIECIWLPIRL